MGDEDRRLVRLSRLCLALPEVTCALRGGPRRPQGAQEGVRLFLNDHHGDGIVSVCIKSALGENVDRAGAQPGRY